MPEPLLYLKAIGAATLVSGGCLAAWFVLVMVRHRECNAERLNRSSALALGLGLAIGYFVLFGPPTWPPVNGLDRLLTIVLPATLIVELVAGHRRVPVRVGWLLRWVLAVSIPRILLHGSVYLSGAGDSSWWYVAAACLAGGGMIGSVWGLLAWLSVRSPGASISLALSVAILSVGLTVMMAGYLKGGAAALPLSATVLATTSVVWMFTFRSAKLGEHVAPFNVDAARQPAILAIGVVGLCGLLLIGRFFGRLSSGSAMTMLLAPLLCWVSEIPLLRSRPPWVVGALRLVLVAIVLAVVLTLAKQTFDRDMAPLLGQVATNSAIPMSAPLETQ